MKKGTTTNYVNVSERRTAPRPKERRRGNGDDHVPPCFRNPDKLIRGRGATPCYALLSGIISSLSHTDINFPFFLTHTHLSSHSHSTLTPMTPSPSKTAILVTGPG